jgi:hypothetical protein
MEKLKFYSSSAPLRLCAFARKKASKGLCAFAPRTIGSMREVFFILFLLSTGLYAQAPRVLIQTAPDRPVAGSPLTLTLLVDHGNPDEVNVFAPPFSEDIILDYMLKGPRIHEGSEKWTAIEFRFSQINQGTVTFDPFTVITPKGQSKTAAFIIDVQEPSPNTSGGTTYFRMLWENVPANLKVGENAIVVLRVNGWRNAFALPSSGLFLPPVPMGHIIESLPISEKEKSSGIALKLRIIPLQRGVLTIANRRLTIENGIYEVPVLRIPVRP